MLQTRSIGHYLHALQILRLLAYRLWVVGSHRSSTYFCLSISCPAISAHLFVDSVVWSVGSGTVRLLTMSSSISLHMNLNINMSFKQFLAKLQVSHIISSKLYQSLYLTDRTAATTKFALQSSTRRLADWDHHLALGLLRYLWDTWIYCWVGG